MTIMIIQPRRLLITALMALLAGKGLGAPLNEAERAYLAAKDEIVFVSQPNHAPFEFARKRQLSGMNVELVQWMAADMGFKVRFETAALAKAQDMLRDGKVDAITSLF